ncbi:MAG TPA: autotransporter-associated beta strand repeat-containing protein, partial [Candidatus Dormibacteraeota bacterium]|nr:autotransporter-associated beta strand repeat-containing protein [Candidatus Dormibacteraeota bacterium]
TLAPAAITGPGGRLVLNGAGDMVIHLGQGTAGSHMATLDLTGLDSLTATVGRLLIGQANAGAVVNRPSGTLILAATNTITLAGGSPQVMVQDSGSNANGSTPSVLTFGQLNFLNADVMRLGGQKGNATLNFGGSYSLPSLTIRNADGVSRSSTIDFGYNGAAPTTGNGTVMTADFSPGSVDLMANLVNIAQGAQAGSGGCTATLTLGAGTFDVNNLEIGWGNANTAGATGTAAGTVNVNNNGGFGGLGALVKVNTQLRLGRTNSPSGPVTGILNVTGGRVQANTIVAGGGASTINLNSSFPNSSLIVTNTIGSLAAPIRNFSMSDAILTIPALNVGAVVAVTNLTVGGSANTINISSIPPIGSYPADFTLINYLGGYTPGAGPLALGTLPSASPAYSGTLVDAGGGVIKLHLTAGPVAVLGMHWTGATDNSWDLGTYNWTFLGFATNYFDGSSPLFDDATTQSNINLTAALSPGTITVSNNTLQYSFVGTGNIAGSGSLTKKGSGKLIVANEGVDTIGSVLINSGTLQIGTNDLNGAISAVTLTNNGSLIVNRSGTLSMSAAIAGGGTLTKTGDGALVLSGANSYTGATALTGGTLQLDGISSGSGALTTSPGTVLAGRGTINGPATLAGQINPGSSTARGAFNANAGLTLNSGSSAAFDLSATDPGNPAANDSINVLGNLTVNNNRILVSFDGAPGGTYTLFTYSGALSGTFNPTVGGTHFTATLDTSAPNFVNLNVSGSGANLRWASVSDAAWDNVATNWLDLGTSLPSPFFAGDNVILDDSPGVVTGISIPSGVNVAPASLTINTTNNSFTISGPGRITGSTGIVKTGPALVNISSPNTFTGPVDIQQGTLQTGNGGALGAASGGTTVEDGATLDVNAQNLGAEIVTITGAGVDGNGALVNNGPAQAQVLRQLVLAGNATVGGVGGFTMNNSGGAASLTTGGGSFNLTKMGGNTFTLQNFTTVDSTLANIDIEQGTLEFSGLTPGMGDASFTNTVAAGATLSLQQTTVAWNKHFNLNGNGSTTTVNVGTGGNTSFVGPVELHGDCVFNITGTLLSISNVISGDGGLIKNGASPLVLSENNSYTGDTRINTGALRINGNGSVAGSANLIIASGATLTATGRIDATLTLSSGQTLKGNGVVNGNVAAPAGSTIAPGIDAIGALTVSNSIVLGGTNVMELDALNGTNDFLRCNGSITYGGTLNLVNLGDPLATGATFKLYNAASYSGSFTSIIPSVPGPNQTWDLSALNSSGTIKVAGILQPRFAGISVTGTNLIMSGSNGTAFNNYYVLASTNVTLPRGTWPRIATNSFDAAGNFRFTNAIIPTIPQRFYQIQLP